MSDFNRVTMTFEFAPDKWMGLETWRRDVLLLEEIATRFGLHQGRSRMGVEREWVMDDE